MASFWFFVVNIVLNGIVEIYHALVENAFSAMWSGIPTVFMLY